ncbi:MAG TPA: alpha-ketoglutarate-dependent dioxygenase AlkB [Rhizomicrobium sp.]
MQRESEPPASRARLAIAEGVALWPAYLNRTEQERLVSEIFARVREAPFYRPRMPRSGKSFSVEETNFGPLGWYSDISGYRYETLHPITGQPWPAMPEDIKQIWRDLAGYADEPECCLVNLYLDGARMGLHQDRDEDAFDAPVLSISLGNEAVFRIGSTTRRGPSRSFLLRSGDVLIFGGVARLAFHGIDRVVENSSTLIPGGGRLNLTLRRITATSQRKDARPGG